VVGNGDSYFRSRYVIEVDEKSGGLLLFCTFTGSIVRLSSSESIEWRSDNVSPQLRSNLIRLGFLINNSRDELKELENGRKNELINSITRNTRSYRIFTTTHCNASCHYCYEDIFSKHSMNEEIADNLAKYILKHSNGVKNSSWMVWRGAAGKSESD